MAPATGASATCLTPAAAGSECQDRPCAKGLICVNNVCAPYATEGEPCDGAVLCASGLWCNAGRCLPPGAQGENCAVPATGVTVPGECASGLVCQPSAVDSSLNPVGYVCAPPGSVGQLCRPDLQTSCQSGLACARETSTCQAPRNQGEPCNPGSPDACVAESYCECSGGYCTGWGSLPDPADVCAPLRADGAPCENGTQCVSTSCASGLCAEPLPCAGL